ncbi:MULTISPECIES: nucleoside-diphosphate kinase [unclassified Paenibacillus]|uniref:nucleoside-diphosphate kinase n=1 Tax=unclassified Paenibacillus TaxID=185978 RepID=UPI002F401FA5
MSKTFVMVKPDGVARGLVGRIVARFEEKGFVLERAQLMHVSKELAEKHYAHLNQKPFFGELVDFITSGPVFAMELSCNEAIKNARSIIGATNPVEAAAGTIRGDYATDVASNIVHGSDSDENAEREIKLFFG